MVQIKERVLKNPMWYIITFLAVLFICLVIMMAVTLFEPMHSTGSDEKETRLAFWSCNNNKGVISVNVYLSDIEGYSDMHIPRYHWTFAMDRYVTPNDRTVMDIAEQMKTITEGMSDLNRVHIVNSLIAHTISYKYDVDAHGVDDYYQFPAETMYLRTGDCEDMAFLEVSILQAMGYDAIPLVRNDHCIVGVNMEGAGVHTDFMGKRYYHLESTSGSPLGISDYGDRMLVPWYSVWGYLMFGLLFVVLILLSLTFVGLTFRIKYEAQ